MIRVAKPHIPEKAIDGVLEVLRSGNLVQGKYVDKFEKKLEKYIGSRHAVLVSSGTAALHLSLLALDVKPGDEVIIPAFTYTATANAVEIIGAKPVLVDITLEDFCIDVSKIESSITSKTKVIMPVHEFGNPAEMDKISATNVVFPPPVSACQVIDVSLEGKDPEKYEGFPRTVPKSESPQVILALVTCAEER